MELHETIMFSELTRLYWLLLLQDDFLPRTPTPLEDIFKSVFWLVQFSYILWVQNKALEFPIILRIFLLWMNCCKYLLNWALMLSTVYRACYFWCAWEILSYRKVGSSEIQEDYMHLVEFIMSLKENFAGKSRSNIDTTILHYPFQAVLILWSLKKILDSVTSSLDWLVPRFQPCHT